MDNRGEPSPAWKMYVDVARSMREDAGLSQEDLGKVINYTGSAISAFETFKVFPSVKLMAGLETALGGHAKLLEKAGRHLVYERYPPHFKDTAKLEAEALGIWSYQAILIDGLFQTEEYARALTRCGYPPLDDDQVEHVVAARMARKAVFSRKSLPLISLVQEESTLRRQVGSPEVMRGQLLHLVEMAQRRHLTVQVLPLDRGAREQNAGVEGSLKLFETPEHQQLAYIESQRHSVLISDPDEVSVISHRYAMIRSQALGMDESLALIERLAGEA